MTNSEKKDRRKVRHTLQKTVAKKHFTSTTKLYLTNNQIAAYARKITDQLLSGRNPSLIEKSE
jgi:hypothetical protein